MRSRRLALARKKAKKMAPRVAPQAPVVVNRPQVSRPNVIQEKEKELEMGI